MWREIHCVKYEQAIHAVRFVGDTGLVAVGGNNHLLVILSLSSTDVCALYYKCLLVAAAVERGVENARQSITQ